MEGVGSVSKPDTLVVWWFWVCWFDSHKVLPATVAPKISECTAELSQFSSTSAQASHTNIQYSLTAGSLLCAGEATTGARWWRVHLRSNPHTTHMSNPHSTFTHSNGRSHTCQYAAFEHANALSGIMAATRWTLVLDGWKTSTAVQQSNTYERKWMLNMEIR